MSARLAPASLYVRSSRRGVDGCGVGLGLWSGGWLCSVGRVVRGWGCGVPAADLVAVAWAWGCGLTAGCGGLVVVLSCMR